MFEHIKDFYIFRRSWLPVGRARMALTEAMSAYWA